MWIDLDKSDIDTIVFWAAQTRDCSDAEFADEDLELMRRIQDKNSYIEELDP